jgi:hypothetical protein
MKCKSFVKYVSAKKKGSGEPYQKAVKIYPRYYEKLGRFTSEPDMVECDGELEVHIEAVTEGECACSSYGSLEIKYKCKKCGAEVFPELPQNSEEISQLVQSYLADGFSEEQRDKMLQDKVDREIAHQKKIDEDIEKMRTKIKKNQDAG